MLRVVHYQCVRGIRESTLQSRGPRLTPCMHVPVLYTSYLLATGAVYAFSSGVYIDGVNDLLNNTAGASGGDEFMTDCIIVEPLYCLSKCVGFERALVAAGKLGSHGDSHDAKRCISLEIYAGNRQVHKTVHSADAVSHLTESCRRLTLGNMSKHRFQPLNTRTTTHTVRILSLLA